MSKVVESSNVKIAIPYTGNAAADGILYHYALIAEENGIRFSVSGRLESEVRSEVIGEMVMAKLKDLDEVAYVRFASVYRSFKDSNTFMEELSKLLGEKR